MIGARRRSDRPRKSLFLSCCAANVAPTVVQAMSNVRGFCFFAFLHRTYECNASAELFASVKEITNPSTGKPVAFVCNGWSHAFRFPSSATDAYPASISHHPLELAAHSVAVRCARGSADHPWRARKWCASGVVQLLRPGCPPQADSSLRTSGLQVAPAQGGYHGFHHLRTEPDSDVVAVVES